MFVSSLPPRPARFLGALVLAIGTAHAAMADTYSFRWANPTPQGLPLNALTCESDAVGYAVGDAGATLRTTDGGATWTDLTRFPAFTTDLHDVLVLGPGELLAVGASPGIFRSLDGGASWTPVPNPSSVPLLNLAVASGDTVVAIGENGQVVRSIDHGATWSLRPSPGNWQLLDQFWFNGQAGYVTGQSYCRRTTDGGATWTTLSGVPDNSQTYTGVYFLDAMNGWILEHFTTYRTVDGGATWFPKHGAFGQSPFYQEDLVVLDAAHRFVVTNLEGAQVWETFDDGLHWTRRYDRTRTAGYTDLDRRPDGTLLATSTFGDLIHSTDGIAWTNATHSPQDIDRSYMEVIAMRPGGHGFAAGRENTWLETGDGGLTWQYPASPPVINVTYAIEFFDDNLVLAGGYGSGSRVVRSTDGGATWSSIAIAPIYVGYVQDIAMPTANICYAVTAGGTGINFVYKSTDGGVTWNSSGAGVSSTNPLYCTTFLSATTGFVGGGGFGDALLYRTRDGGVTWIAIGEGSLPSSIIFDMHWWNTFVGLVATYNGMFRTVNGGVSWSPVITGSMSAISFRNDHDGVAASYLGTGAYVTADSGKTWTSVPCPGGPYLDDIVAVPTGFYGVANGSVILHGVSSTATSVAGTAGAAPGDAGGADLRVVVTPNPAPRVATFRFAGARAGLATLTIHDVRGRIVDRLTGAIGAGDTSLSWDGNAHEPGIYWAVIRLPGGERRTGRFVLVR